MTATMTIDGVAYREAAPPDESDLCVGCAFVWCSPKCVDSTEIARQAFGGHCANRNAIYIRAEESAPAELVCLDADEQAVLDSTLRESVDIVGKGRLRDAELVCPECGGPTRENWDPVPVDSTGPADYFLVWIDCAGECDVAAWGEHPNREIAIRAARAGFAAMTQEGR